MLENVQQKIIKPLFEQSLKPQTLVCTDKYNIYNRLTSWGYEYKTIGHSAGEYTLDEDEDGFHEVHVNTQEGVWSLLRLWLRPHQGISQDKMPIYLSFLWIYAQYSQKRKAILEDLFSTILAPNYL